MLVVTFSVDNTFASFFLNFKYNFQDFKKANKHSEKLFYSSTTQNFNPEKKKVKNEPT